MKVKTNFGEYDVVIDVAKYSSNNNTAIQLYENGDWQPFATITTNIIPLPENFIALDTNNCPWAEAFLEENGLIVDAWGELASGFCVYPVYEIDLNKLNELAKGETK